MNTGAPVENGCPARWTLIRLLDAVHPGAVMAPALVLGAIENDTVFVYPGDPATFGLATW
jgi:hypothetical protein